MRTSISILAVLALLQGCAVDDDLDQEDPSDLDGKDDGQGPCAGCNLLGDCPNDQHRPRCTLDPESLWQVAVVRGVLAETNDGAEWDVAGGAPDPYVICLRRGWEVGRSTVATDTSTPVWDEQVCQVSGYELIENHIGLHVYDADPASYDDWVGLFAADLRFDEVSHNWDVTKTLFVDVAITGPLTQSRLTIRFDRDGDL